MLNCRFCGTLTVDTIIPLGYLPLANALCESSSEKSKTYRLDVMLCQECGLAQLKDIIDPSELFSHYVYFSSHSDAMQESAKNLVGKISKDLSTDAFVVEVASNDGYLLKHYIERGIDVLGIDPAENVVEAAKTKGIPTLCAFFNEYLAIELSYKKADVIHANNVLAHVPDIKGFIKGFKTLLKDNGTLIIEVPYFLDLVQHLEFDTIYHEHVYYFSVKPLIKLFLDADLQIFDIEKIPLHGGSLRLFIGHKGTKTPTDKIDWFVQQEQMLYDLKTYVDFMDNLIKLKKDLKSIIQICKEKKDVIAAYGASAKGTTLLNYFDIGCDDISFVVDKNPIKQGKFTPGKNIPILAPDALLKADKALLLAWNFKSEILKQQQSFIEKGGKFIIPLPHVHLS